MTDVFEKVGVVGAGAWGTALASSAVFAGRDVLLWAREEEVAVSVNANHENSLFLSDTTLPEALRATGQLEDLLDRDILLLVTPAQFLRATCEQLHNIGIGDDVLLVLCSKGIENSTGKLMSEVVQEILPHNQIAVLTGPSFAKEVASQHPSAVSVACFRHKVAEKIKRTLATDHFHLHVNDDIVGSQISGAVKNVIAIGAGIVEGLGLGDNVRAALISLGLSEMGRLAEVKGGQRGTLLDLCGVGDLVLTCTSLQSRNMSFGHELGQGKTVQQLLDERQTVTEGYASAKSVYALSQELDIPMPLCATIYQILYEGIDAKLLLEVMR